MSREGLVFCCGVKRRVCGRGLAWAVAVLVAGLVWGASGVSAAVFHRPAKGTMKDNCVVWHDGAFYMLSMYKPDGGDWNCVWLAKSPDGVHWSDVGAVIKDRPWQVYALRVWKVGDEFIMDHGSFTGPNQDVLRFWKSKDLVHWEYMDEPFAVRRPDGQRLDHMDVTTVDEGGKKEWYGYACGGILRSEDGIRWKWVSDYTVTDNLRGAYPLGPHVSGVGETGGCERIGGKYYLLTGGEFPADLNYAVATYVADQPLGPFRPDYSAFRLCGNSGRKLVCVWAHYCRHPDGLLIANYLYDVAKDNYCMPSLKKAVVDEAGHLRMGYWPGNEAAKGAETPVDWGKYRVETTAGSPSFAASNGAIRMGVGPAPPVGWLTAAEPIYAVAMNDLKLDVDSGFVLEGTMRVDGPGRQRMGGIGVCFEEGPQTGTAVLLEAWGLTQIGKLTWSGTPHFECEDRTGYGCATVAGIPEGATCKFRVLFRQGLFEVYLDDRLVQIFSTEHPTGRVGLVVHDSAGTFGDLHVWPMTLSDKGPAAGGK